MNSEPSYLRAILRSRNPDLHKEAEFLIGKVTPILWRTLSTFPAGTQHTSEHTNTVEIIAGMLIEQELASQLNDEELYLLLLACHFHDAAMSATDWHNQTIEGKRLARDEHAILVGQRIQTDWRTFGFPNKRTAEILGEICKGHRPKRVDGIANWDDFAESEILKPGKLVRIRLVCALVYAADELHLGHDRASERELDWVQIQDPVSRRHWRRHNAISGPAVDFGQIRFDLSIPSLGLENDIRREVLYKAFGAVRDLKSQLVRDRINKTIPTIVVHWKREQLWRLLVIEASSDLVARTQNELEEKVHASFIELTANFLPLSDVCIELPADTTLVRASIRRTIDEFTTQNWLLAVEENNVKLKLAGDSRIWNEFIKIVRQADDLENLFRTVLEAQHEFRLCASPAGEIYIAKGLSQKVQDVFGVRINSEHEKSNLRIVLGKSPTACQMIESMRSNPSVFVYRHPLQLLLLAGISYDLQRNPELFLDTNLRRAVREMSDDSGAQMNRFLRYTEESALLLGFSHEQLNQLVLTEQDLLGLHDHPGSEAPTLRISQSVPLKERQFDLGRILVAHNRSAFPVEILNLPFAKLQIRHASISIPDEPVSLALSQPKQAQPGRFSLRGSLIVDSESRTATFRGEVVPKV